MSWCWDIMAPANPPSAQHHPPSDKAGRVVAIGGRDLDGMSDKELARHVSVVLTDRIEPDFALGEHRFIPADLSDKTALAALLDGD